MIKFTLYGDPKTKKNSQQIFHNKRTHKPFISQSEIYKQYEIDCVSQITGNLQLHIDYEINVKAIFYRKYKTNVDLANLLSALHDVLKAGGVIKDDNFKVIVSVDGSRIKFDKENPRTEIEIMEV